MGKLKIEMLGTSFTIQANEENEYLEKLLGYYKRITEDVGKIDSIKSPLQTAILSGIMICDELYKEKQRKITMQNNGGQVSTENDEEIELRTKQMIEKISKVL